MTESSIEGNKSPIVMAPCRHGRMVWPCSDKIIGRSLALYGEFAEGENRLMARFVKRGDTVVDIGANLGTTVLALARATGNSGAVLAFEPQPKVAQLLQTSLTLNGILHVRTHAAALADKTGWSRIAAPDLFSEENFGAMTLAKEGVQDPVFRLDEIELNSCALIKLDVEGLESRVLSGARGHIQNLRPVLYFEAKRIPGTEECLQWLLDNGWHCYWHFAFFFSQENFRNNQTNVFGASGDMNVLAVPDEKPQPEDLPRIFSPGEDWRNVYADFFRKRGVTPA